MRKPRDFDAALKTLTGMTRVLKEVKRRQPGELHQMPGPFIWQRL